KFAVIRLNADGGLDTTFNGTGWVTTDLSSASSAAYAVATAPDGKIVAAGGTGLGSAAASRTVVVRYLANGTPDESFGPGGVRETEVGGYIDRATDAAVQQDGKVVVTATLRRTGDGLADFAVLRFNADGTPDSGFAANGVYTE